MLMADDKRGRDAAAALGPDVGGAIAEIAHRVVTRVDSEHPDALVATPVGGLRLIDYLPTRTFELTVHTCKPDDSRRNRLSDPDISIQVDDVDACHAEAVRIDAENVHPLTDEAGGVRRFFVRDPHGHVINIVSHT